MKVITFLLYFVLVACLAACGSDSGVVTPPSTGSIRGIVLNAATGQPVVSATVATIPSSSVATTDVSGKFLLQGLEPGQFVVVATSPSVGTGIDTVLVAAGDTAAATIILGADGSTHSDTLVAPFAPTPTDGSQNQQVFQVLGWRAAGPGVLKFDIYFGTDPQPQLARSNHDTNRFVVGSLQPGTQYFWRVVAHDTTGAVKSSPVWTFSTTTLVNNNPPLKPNTPAPANGAVSQPYSLTLRWSSSDPDNDPITYDVLFGTDPTPSTAVSQNSPTARFDVSGLAQQTTYFWQVIARDNHNGVTAGPVWSFTTKTNLPPNAPNGPSPSNGSVRQALNLQLRWNATDDDGDPLQFDVYFGTDNPPTTRLASSITAKSISVNGLQEGVTCYWQVVARDPSGGETTGPVWSFSTTEPYTRALIAHLPLDGDASDVSGHGHDGTVIGAVPIPDRHGRPSGALHFNGFNDYVRVPHDPELNFESQLSDFTISAWVELDGSQDTYDGIVAKGPVETDYPGYMLVILKGDRMGVAVGEPGFIVGNGSTGLNDGHWHLLTLVVKAQDHVAQLYVDGRLDGQAADPSVDLTFENSEPLYIGVERNRKDFFTGSIDDVRIYNYALAPSDIVSLFLE